jgi:hypothetical protein
VDVEGILAISGFFGTCIVAFVSFGPIGRAIGAHILRKSAAGTPPEIGEQLDELAERVEAQDFAERLLAKVREKGLPAGGPA